MLYYWGQAALKSNKIYGSIRAALDPRLIRQDMDFVFVNTASLAKRSIKVIADDQKVLKTPLQVEVVPKKLRVIVGKERRF